MRRTDPDLTDLTGLAARARLHAALGDPVRLAVAEELARSDRAPVELRERFGLESNLLAHHLDVLEEAGLIGRSKSSGDGRRRYVHLLPAGFALVTPPSLAGVRMLFVCTQNSARSQLAAALWQARAGSPAASAGTHPADRVHPGAVAAARRAGLDLTASRPRALDRTGSRPRVLGTPAVRGAVVVTVCDRAHEELGDQPDWLHWSVPDPVPAATRAAFDAVVVELTDRIDRVTTRRSAA